MPFINNRYKPAALIQESCSLVVRIFMKLTLVRLSCSLIAFLLFASLDAQSIDGIRNNPEKITYDSTQVRLMLEDSAIKEAQIKEMAARTEAQAIRLRQTRLLTAGIITAATTLLMLSWLFARKRENLFQETRKAAELDRQVLITLKDHLRDAQLTAARAQMDPHFVFNAINAIQNLILREDRAEAVTYLNDFSRLARQTLDNSSKNSVSINEEVDFLTRYLHLEQLRSGYAFTFKIETVNIECDFDRIPTMLVQPLAENAIRHGLAAKAEKGTLLIRFMRSEEDNLIVIVDDDGIGREAALVNKPHTGHESMAMHITEKRMRLINEQHSNRPHYPVQVEDKLGAQGQPLGTRVTLTIPAIQLRSIA
jgi:LytS/YehU family sensor histidine kinase